MAKPEKLMNFGAVLKKYRKNAGCTQQKLAEILGISKNTVTLWERNLARPDVETIRELNQMFGIPLNELFEIPSAPKYSFAERKLIDYFRQLDESDQTVVERMVSEMAAARDDERYKAYQDEYSLIQFSATRPAAGSGNEFVDDKPTYRFVRNNDRSMNADILIQISGRSMEPRYYDGDIVYAKYTNSAEDGQDVICSTADGAVIKHKSGNKLVSLNSDLPYGEKSEDDHVQIEAVVLGIVPSWDLAKPEEIDMLEEAHRKEVRAFKDKYGLEY